jgi:hypothetical protein
VRESGSGIPNKLRRCAEMIENSIERYRKSLTNPALEIRNRKEMGYMTEGHKCW